mgnify:FL=1
MYSLFILGQLMDVPMSGYALRQSMINVLGRPYVIGWGTLYPLLDRLSEQGDIILHDDVNNDSKRKKRLAEITQAGQKHFFEMILEPVKITKQTEQLLQVKCNFLHLLNQEQAKMVLNDYQDYCLTGLVSIREHRQLVSDRQWLTPADERDFHQVTDLQSDGLQVQLDWVRKQLKSLKRHKEV